MRRSDLTDMSPVSERPSHRFENMVLVMSVVGFLSMAGIYLLLN